MNEVSVLHDSAWTHMMQFRSSPDSPTYQPAQPVSSQSIPVHLTLRFNSQEVKRLKDVLSLAADEVFSLENAKAQLALSAQERRHEVEVHR
jgi:hypothetical protein